MKTLALITNTIVAIVIVGYLFLASIDEGGIWVLWMGVALAINAVPVYFLSRYSSRAKSGYVSAIVIAAAYGTYGIFIITSTGGLESIGATVVGLPLVILAFAQVVVNSICLSNSKSSVDKT